MKIKNHIKNNDYILYYYRTNSFFNNLYSKLLILISIIYFYISKSGIYYFKKYNMNQNEILRLENQTLSKLNLNGYDKIMLLKIITNNNKRYYQGIENCLLNDPDNQLCIYHLLAPKKVIGKKRILIGEKKDGSYILLNDFKNIKIAYSFGIGKNIQFDKYLADKGIDVYMYDHTIHSLPFNNTKFHWKKIGMTGQKNKANKYLKSLKELIIENNHSSEENMILKIDIEFAEWESLRDLPSKILSQFKYILIEYHFNEDRVINQTLLYYNVLKKLYDTHQVFYLHCNNQYLIVNFGNNRFCQFLEVSYIIKKDNEFTKDHTIYPIKDYDFYDLSKYISRKGEMNLNILKLFDNS